MSKQMNTTAFLAAKMDTCLQKVLTENSDAMREENLFDQNYPTNFVEYSSKGRFINFFTGWWMGYMPHNG